MTTIICPKCKNPVEISEALSEQIEAEKLAQWEEDKQAAVQKAREEASLHLQKKLQEQFELKLKQLQEDAAEKDEHNKELIKQITELTRELRNSKRQQEETELKMQQKLAEEEDKIRTDAIEKAAQEQHSKISELQKQLLDAAKANDELKRKLEQGSQQTQGEAFELEFEEMLKRQYPNDKIIPVGKGVRGGDIIQEVWDAKGNFSGKILWELKNTKTWSEIWVDKLKSDKRSANAEEAVIISQILPNNLKHAGFRDGVWVTERQFCLPLCDTIRAKIIQLYYVRNSIQLKDERMEILYKYLTGNEFRHSVVAIIEAFTNMQEEIE
ncbi:MAG: DUF2130 domain-containing protein, partial [Rhabdochlamydiaceae bacterium]